MNISRVVSLLNLCLFFFLSKNKNIFLIFLSRLCTLSTKKKKVQRKEKLRTQEKKQEDKEEGEGEISGKKSSKRGRRDGGKIHPDTEAPA